jgi:type II secretory pathway pseudopilin PulG
MKTQSLMKQLTDRGDTIVEVMFVLAILALAISASYSTASRSLLNTRQADETSQATELVQSTISQLIADSPQGSTQNIYQTSNFCLNASGQVTAIPPAPTPFPCQINGLYDITVTPPGSPTGGLFTVEAKWPDLTGNIQNGGYDTSTLSYIINQS